MNSRARTCAAGVLATATAFGVAVMPPAASARQADPVEVLATNLGGPFGLQSTSDKGAVVALSEAGRVVKIGPKGRKNVVFGQAQGVSSAATGDGRYFAIMGGPPPPEDEAQSARKQLRAESRLKAEALPPGVATYAPTSVLRSTPNGRHVDAIANLQSYELAHNPDGQKQFDENGDPYDTLSNPFAMNYSKRFGLLVADGGGNDVLRVNPRTGHVSTFFVPPTVTDVEACDGAQANPGTEGCDPVPTGVDVVGKYVYVSTLGADVPGAGRVYKLNGAGSVVRVIRNLDSPTGVAANRKGTVFVSQATADAGPGDPADWGQVTRIKNGTRTLAQVTQPTGLDFRHGRLYASTGSLTGPGEVVSIGSAAFAPPV